MKIKDTPLFILLMFTLVYATIGDSEVKEWSGAYFFVNYITMFWLFYKEKSRLNRIIGMALSISIILFIILKYFFEFEYDRVYTFVPFFVSLISIYILEKK